MQSKACDRDCECISASLNEDVVKASHKPLEKQGYLFFSDKSSAALKPCMWNKRSLQGDEMCYKHKFYGITSHRCVQFTPTLKCNQRCLFCWRSMEYKAEELEECSPKTILSLIPKLQKKSLAGYNCILQSSSATEERWGEALKPNMAAISLSGEPTLYSKLPELIDLLNAAGYTTFLVSNGTNPNILKECHPYQTYVSLDAPDYETYLKVCRPDSSCGDPRRFWENISESISLLKDRRSALRTTVVRGYNDFNPQAYAAMYQKSGADFIEVKGYMYVGHSRERLLEENMPSHLQVRDFAMEISKYCDYEIIDESPISRVVCMKKRSETEKISDSEKDQNIRS